MFRTFAAIPLAGLLAGAVPAATDVKLIGQYAPGKLVRLEYTGIGSRLDPYVVLEEVGETTCLYLPVKKVQEQGEGKLTYLAEALGFSASLEVATSQGGGIGSARIRTHEVPAATPVELYPMVFPSDELIAAGNRDHVLVSHWGSRRGGLETLVMLYRPGQAERHVYRAEQESDSPTTSRFVVTLGDGSQFSVILERTSPPKARLIGTDGSTQALRILELGPGR